MDEEKRKAARQIVINDDLKQPDAISSRRKHRASDLCPFCKNEQIDYNGLLNLVCPNCGLIEGGCFT